MNLKQRAFVENYLNCWNATEAARQAGYAHAHVQSSRLLADVSIQKEIQQRLSEKTLSADEVLSRLAEQARGEHGKYLLPDGVNLAALIADGKGHLVKGIKQTRYGLDIDFYDAQNALVQIGKHLGLFSERLDLTTGGETLNKNDERFDRALFSLADALRESLSDSDAGTKNAVDTAEQAAVACSVDEGG